MKYLFTDITKSTDISVKILSNSKYLWVTFSTIIINLTILLIFNFFSYIIFKNSYLEGLNANNIYSLKSVNFFIFISGFLIQFVFVLEAKIHKKMKSFYFKEETSTYKNLFSNLTIVFFCLLYFIIISIFAIEIYKDSFTTETYFLYFLIMFFFILTPVYLLVIFNLYKHVIKYFLVILINAFENHFYYFTKIINREIANTRSTNQDYSVAVLILQNMNEIKNSNMLIKNSEIIKTVIKVINNTLNQNLIITSFNNKKVIMGIFNKLKSEPMKDFIQNSIAPVFEKPVLINNKNVFLKFNYEVINITSDHTIKDTYDIINIYD